MRKQNSSPPRPGVQVARPAPAGLLRDEVVGPDLLAENRRDPLDDPIADRMAERVVVPLERRDIDEADGTPPGALLERKERFELLHEPSEVHQLRLRVAARLVGELAHEPFEVVGDVADRRVALHYLVAQRGHTLGKPGEQRLDRFVLRRLPEALLTRDHVLDDRVELGLGLPRQIQARVDPRLQLGPSARPLRFGRRRPRRRGRRHLWRVARGHSTCGVSRVRGQSASEQSTNAMPPRPSNGAGAPSVCSVDRTRRHRLDRQGSGAFPARNGARSCCRRPHPAPGGRVQAGPLSRPYARRGPARSSPFRRAQEIRSGCDCCTGCVRSSNSSACAGCTLSLVERWRRGVRARSRLAHGWRRHRGFGSSRSGRRVGCNRSARSIAGGGRARCRTGLRRRHRTWRTRLLRQHEPLPVCVTRDTPGERDGRRWGRARLDGAGRLILRGVRGGVGDQRRCHGSRECAHHDGSSTAPRCTSRASLHRT